MHQIAKGIGVGGRFFKQGREGIHRFGLAVKTRQGLPPVEQGIGQVGVRLQSCVKTDQGIGILPHCL